MLTAGEIRKLSICCENLILQISKNIGEKQKTNWIWVHITILLFSVHDEIIINKMLYGIDEIIIVIYKYNGIPTLHYNMYIMQDLARQVMVPPAILIKKYFVLNSVL